MNNDLIEAIKFFTSESPYSKISSINRLDITDFEYLVTVPNLGIYLVNMNEKTISGVL